MSIFIDQSNFTKFSVTSPEWFVISQYQHGLFQSVHY
ncbi:hypothetical protein PUN4_590005 [Paraburkholderia unamae]|nr:hypothetical protein PUN4_590005 [Paraburkholderia unamae]